MNSHSIIGSILYNPKCLGVISDHIRPEMLDIKEARVTLQAMLMMDIAGEPIDLVTVKNETAGHWGELAMLSVLKVLPPPRTLNFMPNNSMSIGPKRSWQFYIQA